MNPNEVMALAFWVILGLIIWAAVHLANIYHDGVLDAKFPDVADGDWRTGWRRRLYLAGRTREEQRQRLVTKRSNSEYDAGWDDGFKRGIESAAQEKKAES